MTNAERASKWRSDNGYAGRGGVIVIFGGEVNGWVNELREPNHWRPGCIAVDESGREWQTRGGNAADGAVYWEPVKMAA
ncbi:MAG TPA: hypothetical protein DCS05_08770 [Nitrospiraceae bacterium]|nr:hypothetical protein [Nitrospiraceae bacterium]